MKRFIVSALLLSMVTVFTIGCDKKPATPATPAAPAGDAAKPAEEAPK
jgi:hypothetical protein